MMKDIADNRIYLLQRVKIRLVMKNNHGSDWF
jgi:hypothetical protein